MLRELKRLCFLQKVGYEDVLLVVSAMGNHERSWSRHKDYFDKSSALQSLKK
jgi:hypothetical protein